MDTETLAAYDHTPADYAAEWHDQPAPTDLHDLVRTHFRPGGRTADVGCGSGRDTAWLSANGFPATGYDPSEGLLAQARLRHPGIPFHVAALPELAGVADGSYPNVLCETVLMHLPPALIPASVRRLRAILAPGGALYLSWRVTAGADRRDDNGRLYAAFDPALVRDALAGTTIVHDAEVGSLSSGKLIHRIVVAG